MLKPFMKFLLKKYSLWTKILLSAYLVPEYFTERRGKHDQVLTTYYINCSAFLYPSFEDVPQELIMLDDVTNQFDSPRFVLRHQLFLCSPISLNHVILFFFSLQLVLVLFRHIHILLLINSCLFFSFFTDSPCFSSISEHAPNKGFYELRTYFNSDTYEKFVLIY